MNSDGQVTLADLRRLLRMLLGLQAVDLTKADLDGDGRLGLADLRALARLLIGA